MPASGNGDHPHASGVDQETTGDRQERTKKRKRFPHGNYTGYYRTRCGIDTSGTSATSATDASGTTSATTPAGVRDPRLGLMRRSWFEGKKCLDVGCNEGYLTLALVRYFRPRRMVGVDIDSYLVQRARRALLAEINAAADAGVGTLFRPLMPRSLRGDTGGVNPQEAANGTAKNMRDEPCAGARDDRGDCGVDGGRGDGESSQAMGGSTRTKDCGDSPKLDTQDAGESSALPKSYRGNTTCTDESFISTCGNSDSVLAVRKTESAPRSNKPTTLGRGDSDTRDDVASTDVSGPASAGVDAAAVAAAAAAVGVVADPAADDAKVLSGCTVSFRCEDFVAEAHGDHGYDVVCLFSVVKWMHINGGDEALRSVFQKAYSLLRTGGRLILEPQPWKTYRKSARQHGTEEARVIVGAIKLRPRDFPTLLTGEVGFRSWEEIGLPAEGIGGFAKRSVHVFVK